MEFLFVQCRFHYGSPTHILLAIIFFAILIFFCLLLLFSCKEKNLRKAVIRIKGKERKSFYAMIDGEGEKKLCRGSKDPEFNDGDEVMVYYSRCNDWNPMAWLFGSAITEKGKGDFRMTTITTTVILVAAYLWFKDSF